MRPLSCCCCRCLCSGCAKGCFRALCSDCEACKTGRLSEDDEPALPSPILSLLVFVPGRVLRPVVPPVSVPGLAELGGAAAACGGMAGGMAGGMTVLVVVVTCLLISADAADSATVLARAKSISAVLLNDAEVVVIAPLMIRGDWPGRWRGDGLAEEPRRRAEPGAGGIIESSAPIRRGGCIGETNLDPATLGD